MIKPIRYVSLFPSTFNESGYNVSHNTGPCAKSFEGSRSVHIINCSTGRGVLLDDLTQPDINSTLTDQAIQAFSTWIEKQSLLNHTFITLQFLTETIITRVMLYCLVLQGLKIREPRELRLFSSTAESIYPTAEIEGIGDPNITVLSTGSTNIRRSSGSNNNNNNNNRNNNNNKNNGNNDDNTVPSSYEYRKFDLQIPRDSQIPLNFLRISMDFEGDDWIFVSEVETYHIEQLSESLHRYVAT